MPASSTSSPRSDNSEQNRTQTDASPTDDSESENIYSIVYISASTGLFSDEELRAILEKSRANNKQRSITGMLVYIEGSIFQVLEGPKDKVMPLFKTIAQDPRHTLVTPLIQQHQAQRNFPEWTMGFKSIDREQLQELDGFRELRTMEDFLATIRQSPEKAHILLRTFYDSNSRH